MLTPGSGRSGGPHQYLAQRQRKAASEWHRVIHVR